MTFLVRNILVNFSIDFLLVLLMTILKFWKLHFFIYLNVLSHENFTVRNLTLCFELICLYSLLKSLLMLSLEIKNIATVQNRKSDFLTNPDIKIRH